MAKKVYAVKNGRQAGIFYSWDECKEAVDGFPGAVFKGFLREDEAKAWLSGENSSAPKARKTLEGATKAEIPFRDSEEDEADFIVYTDGSCLKNPDGPGGWGVVVIETSTGEVTELSGGEASTTNNRMEMTAAIRALETVPSGKKVLLYTDSQYMKNAFTKFWLRKWKKTGWITSQGTPVLNKDLWIPLDKLVSSRRLTFRWVKGHVGIEYNERCDKLAKGEAAKFL